MAMVTVVTITVDIASTMSTKVPSRSRASIGLCAGAVSFLLTILTFFQIMAYAHLVYVSPRVEISLKTGSSLSQPISSAALGAYQLAVWWLPVDAELYQTMGRLELRNAASFAESDPQYLEALERSRNQFTSAIFVAPARSFSWTLLAHASNETEGSKEMLNRLLRMSYFLGPHEASNVLLRSYIEGKRWNDLDADLREYAQRDFLAIWLNEQLHPKLFQIYVEASFGGRMGIRRAILPDRAAADLFDQQLLKFTGLLKP